MIKFYIPFYYLVYSRLKKKLDIISWHLVFILPQFFITYFYLEPRPEFFVLLFLFSQVIFHTLYEIGYINNDILTIKNEKNPTYRLDRKTRIYIKKNYFKIIYFRYLIVLFSLGLLCLTNIYFELQINVLAFIVLLLVNMIFFLIHNSIRNRWNIATYFGLSVTKYIFPIVLFIGIENILHPIILSVLAFPLLRTIEQFMLKRHNFKNFVKKIDNLDRFRIIYYFILLIVCGFVWHFFLLKDENLILSIIVLLYFLIYRFLSYYVISRGIHKRDNKTIEQYPLN